MADLGSLTASFGIDLSQLNQAEGAVRGFGAAAESSLGQATAASESLISSLVALTGVALSVGGAFSAFKGGIEMIDQFNLKVISNAAMLTNLYSGPPEKAQEAYAQFKAYVVDMYSAFTAEAAKHISKASDMQDTFKAFSQFGVKATKDQAGAIGVITDAVRLLNNGMMSEGSMLHEIMGLEAGHASVRFKLGMQVRQIEGENWHQVYLEHKKIGDVIPWLASLYKGLAAATSDVQKELLSQRTTLQGLTAFITRQGLAGAYEDVVSIVKKLNNYLTQHKDIIISQMVESWDRFRNAIIETSDKIDEFATKHPILMSLGGILVKLTAYTVGLSTAVRTIKASWDWVSGGIIAAVGTVTGAFRAIIGVVGGVTSEFYAVMTSAGVMGEAIGTAPGLGAAVAVSAIITMAGHIAARLTMLIVDWVSSWEIAGKTVGDYCNLGLLYFEQFGVGAASIIQNTVTVIERAWEEMTYVLKKGFLDVLSIGQNLPMVGGVFSGFEGQSKELDKDHEKTVRQINEHLELLNKQNEAIKKNIQLQVDAINSRNKVATGIKPPETGFDQNLPPTRPGDVGKTKGGKGGKGAEGAEGQVASMMQTLNQELMKINEGAANEVLGWADKMVTQLEKVQAKGGDVSEAMPLVWEVALAKEQKLQEDFNKWYAGNIGDNYTKIKNEQDETVKKYVMSQEKMTQLAAKAGEAQVSKMAEGERTKQALATATANILTKLVQQNEATKQRITEVTTRKNQLEDISRQTQLIGLAKQYYDQMGPLLPNLDQQNAYKRQALELENRLAILGVEKLVRENKDLEQYRDRLLLMQAMVNQGKLFNLEMEQNKGLQGWAYQRVKQEQSKNTWSDFMEGAESFISDAFSQGIQGALTKSTKSFQQVAADMAQSFILNMAKRGIHEVFTGIAGLLVPGLGKDKPDGSLNNPFFVTNIGGGGSFLGGGQGGGGLFGGSGLFGGGQGAGGNKESLRYWDDYKTTGLDSIGAVSDSFLQSQNAMTAANAAGQMARIAGMSSGASQGIGILGVFAKGAILMDAGQAAAGAFKGVMETIPPPFSWILAPIAAAAAFAAVLAFGSGLGGGGGRASATGGGPGEYSPGAYASGGIVTHPTLAWIGEGGNDEAIIPLQGGMVPVKLSGGSGGTHYHDNSTMQIGDRADVGDFKQALRKHRTEIVRILREEKRNFTKVG